MVKRSEVNKVLRSQSTSESICRTVIITVVISKQVDALFQAFRFCFWLELVAIGVGNSRQGDVFSVDLLGNLINESPTQTPIQGTPRRET